MDAIRLLITNLSNQRMYGASLMAWKIGVPILVEHQASVLIAESEEDALRQAMAQALESWPPADHWQGHDAQVLTLVLSFTSEPLKQIETEQELVM